ncbi:MAG: type I restriction enzyme HsdR N-terminal domain-containing protein [Bacteroidetes bacterium]|nr:type I restriction enzyme HsdR N-terminal domain-containing protein [Bacteroidota bacterium]MBU1422852.1 type I restriction enzyme HsdR N-terminal domain-containing protein [Bacteroidota bacterium]
MNDEVMTEAQQRIKQLVKYFKEQEAAYLSPGYQESQLRQDFLDKFFAALGWDVTHELQKNPYEQEVKIENKVNAGRSQRRADFAFFIAPNFRDVKFFVEAKKPSRNLANPVDYYQTIRYGWNSKTPIAVLTDFEEFHILDCRFKPDIKTALDRKIEAFHYTDYEDEEKFKRIYYLFNHDDVANGSIEKFAANLPKPRAKTARKGMFKVEYKPVDESFLEVLDEYRDTLARAFKNKNQNLEGEELTEAVQRIIDRLVFIRFLEDKSIEDSSISAIKDKPAVWKAFVALCKRLEPKYNGLVFKPHRIIDSLDFNPPEDKLFADICSELAPIKSGLADPTSPYDFDKIPISILGSIYERFLGKVVSTSEKRAKVIEKPEVRKTGGVYYTPEYIVRYIVTETIGKLLYEKRV